jgi:thioredoxin 1
VSDLVIHVTDNNFEQMVLKADKPVLVDYWAEWCGPCRELAPVLDQIALKYAQKIVVAKLNIDENQDTAAKYAVRSIPTLMIFKNGEVEATKVGSLNQSKLAEFINPHV